MSKKYPMVGGWLDGYKVCPHVIQDPSACTSVCMRYPGIQVGLLHNTWTGGHAGHGGRAAWLMTSWRGWLCGRRERQRTIPGPRTADRQQSEIMSRYAIRDHINRLLSMSKVEPTSRGPPSLPSPPSHHNPRPNCLSMSRIGNAGALQRPRVGRGVNSGSRYIT